MSDEETKTAPVIQHPAQATHMALPAEVMQELITAAAQKYTWAELDPLMSKVKTNMMAQRVGPDGIVQVKPPEA